MPANASPPLRQPRVSDRQHPLTRVRSLVLVGACLTTLLFAGLAGYSTWQSRQQHVQRAELLTQNLAEVTANSLSANVDKIDLTLSSIVSRLEEDLADGVLNLAHEGADLQAQIAHRPELDGIRVTNAQGIAILGPGLSDRAPLDLSDRAWFQAQRADPQQGLLVSPPLQSRLNGQWIMSFSRAYHDRAGGFAGVVSASVPLSYFTRLLAAVNAGPHGSVLLRDGRLGLVSRHPPLPGPAGEVGSMAITPELQKAARLPGWTGSTYHSTNTPDGETRTYTARRLASAPLILVVGVAAQDYLEGWWHELWLALATSLAVALLYGAGSLLLLRVLAQNRAARQRIDLLAKVFEHSGEAILVTDHDNRIVEVNPAFERQTGYRADEVLGCNPNVLASGRTSDEQYRAMWQALNEQGEWRGELWDRSKEGEIYPKWMSITLLRDAAGAVTHHIASFIDISEVKQAEERILHLAHHDALTRLPNRMHLAGRLEQAMATARREGSELAMLFIDMDRFKNINDTLGHQVGDALLVEVAARLNALVRDSDIVARSGGDEFVLVLTGLGSESARAATAVARKVMTELSRPYEARGHALHSTPSIGISLFPRDGSDAETLMKSADTAMYHAKAAGRNTFQFYTEAMNALTTERLNLEQGLRTAIERNELYLVYQPQLALATGEVVGLEALLRWHHPALGDVPPLKFIPVAEEAGLIGAIGEWVLDRALAQLAQWRSEGQPRLRVAVNLSAHQLRDDSVIERVAQLLARHQLPGEALELEITESVAMRDPIHTAVLLGELRKLGVALAIDDFGTGYSSLAYLKQLPLNCLKLDRSFVMDIEHDANDAAISAATITLSHSLGLAVVAEGVENQAQLDFLRGLGCDIVQGYHLSRPLKVADCSAFLQHLRTQPADAVPA